MLNRILVLLYVKSGFFIPLRSVQKYNWDPSQHTFYLAKKITCCQLSDKMLNFLHLVANETKLLLWSTLSQDKLEFLFITIIFFYYLCFSPLNSSKPLQSSLTSTVMFPAKVAMFSCEMSIFSLELLMKINSSSCQTGYIFIYVEIGDVTVLPRTYKTLRL